MQEVVLSSVKHIYRHNNINMAILNYLLFVFVFSNQLIGGFNAKLPSPSYGNVISILSIDGGGIKGIIPTVILEHLEKAIQEVSKDDKAVLADYFDVIAGTSTGGIIATMLTAPNSKDITRPIFNTSEILDFYLKYGPSIFNLTNSDWNATTRGPKFDGKFLYSKTRELLGDARLHQTLTNLVIPTFELKEIYPVIFSSLKVKTVPRLDAKLSDIALGTSAAPTQLPAYYFKDGDNEFNLVDGSITAASPALVAVSEVLQQVKEKNPDFIKENEPTKILLLSLGTGSGGTEEIHISAALANFLLTAQNWTGLFALGLASSSGNLNHYHLATLFPGFTSSDNYYLRIEEYNLTKTTAVADNTTAENMKDLKETGQNLLKQTVKTMNVTHFVPEEKPSEGTNAEALGRLAKVLYDEKQLRLKKKSMEKMGRPFVELLESV